MAHDVWLPRSALITCLLLSVLAGNTNGGIKTHSTHQMAKPSNIKHSTNNGFTSGPMHSLIRNSSFEVKHDTRKRHKEGAHIKSGTTRLHARLKKTSLAESKEDHSTKRNQVAGSEETGANRPRMQALDRYFVHRKVEKETPREKNGFTKSRDSFLSALPLDGFYTRRPNTEMAVQSGESGVRMMQNVDREVSAQFLDWSRKGLGNDRATEKGVGTDGLHVNPVTSDGKFDGENSVEGRKIVHAASLVESSLESQGTGLNEPIKYPGEKVGNRARAFQYFLPTHSPIKMKQRSRYRYVNSLIKPQLAGISADITGLEAQRHHTELVNLKALKDSLKSGGSMTETQLNDSEVKVSKDMQDENGNTERKARPQYNANDIFMLGSPDRPNYLQGLFLWNTQQVPLFPGSGDERKFQNKYKWYSMVRNTSHWQKNPGTLRSNQSKIPGVSFGNLQESVLQELIHSGVEMNPKENSKDLNLKLPIISKAGKTAKATSQVSFQSFKDKATSYVEEDSNSFQNSSTQGSGVLSATTKDSSEKERESPSSYFRPTKMHGFPKVTTLRSYTRTTIPHRSNNFEFESSPSNSGEGSGSGEDVMLQREHHHRHKPTQSAVAPLSTTLKPQTGILGVKDKKTKKKCEKMGKSDYREKCPSEWIKFNEFCYLFVPHSVRKWEEFPQECNKENALLAMPKTEKERKFLQYKIPSLKHRTRYFYIGLKKTIGAWTWIDGVPYIRDVHVTDTLGTKNCGAISRGGGIKMVTCNEPKAGYVCELRTGVRALSLLAFGDSLTSGFHSVDKSRTPYAKHLENLLNKDVHRCYTLTTVAKDGTEASEMSSQLQSHLNTTKTKYSWVIILAGTNDILHNSNVRNRRAWDSTAEHIIDLHITSHRFGAKTMAVTIPEMDCEESDRPPCLHTRLERKYINEKLRHYARTNDFTVLCDLAEKFPRYSLTNEERKKLWEEGLHMKLAGYEKMAEIIYRDLLGHVDDEDNL